MESPTLRSAIDADVDAVLAFWLEAGENDARPTDRPDAVRRQLARDPDALLVAELDGRIVGTVIAGWDGWRAHLYRLAVHPSYRRRGIATLILAHAEGRLRTLGATRFDAMVLTGNDLGAPAWIAAGYTQQAEWRCWVKRA